MKKKLLSLALILILTLTCILGLTACANGQITSARIIGIEVIIKDNFDSPNYYSCTYDNIKGNKEAFTMDDVKVYYKYSDGKRKLLKEDAYSYCKYTDGAFYSQTPFQFMLSGETSDSIPGKYIMRFYSNSGDYTADLVVDILKVKRPDLTCSTYLNEYTDSQRTEVKKTNMLASKEFVEINYMQNVFSDSPCFFTTSATELKEYEITHLILKYSEEYYSDPDSYIKAENIVGYHKGLKFCAKDDSYLTPGDYLLIPTLPESIVYLSDFGDAVKVRILPISVNTATEAISKSKSDHTFGSITYMFGNIKSETGSPFSLKATINITYYNHVMINYFENNGWKKMHLSNWANSAIKVHAYKDLNNNYALVDYIDGKWYAHNSTTEVNSSLIEYISYDSISSTQIIDSSIYLTLDINELSEVYQEHSQYFANLTNLFKIPLEIVL